MTLAARTPRIHFSGIGGTAMVAGARLALELGWEVRGSDNPLYPPTSHMVAGLGVPVYEGYAAANLDWNPDIVVLGNALSRGNPEVEAALARRLHYVSLPEWMKDAVLRRRRPVVVAGTHGKTTTTALAAWTLERCGLAPGYFIGGEPLGFAHSAFLGAEGAPFVIEGDEYDTAFFDKRAKFFHYLPEIAVVTSVEFDHGDIYRDLDEIELAFQRMLRQIPAGGWLFPCADDPGAAALRGHAPCGVMTYGFHGEADWRGAVLGWEGACQVMRVYRRGEHWGEVRLALAGEHNARNALAAIAVADAWGAEPAAVSDALQTFPGVRRRLEVFHEARGVVFVDDFAHHPTAIRETIRAARSRWAGHHLVVLFEPRSNTTVTKRFQGDLADSFAGADKVWIGPIYRGDRIADDERLDRPRLVEDIGALGVPATFVDDVTAIVNDLREHAVPRTVVLILSNGAFGGIYGRLRDAFV